MANVGKIKFHKADIGGEIVKDNEVYQLRDNKTLNNLVLSSTRLYRGQLRVAMLCLFQMVLSIV